MQMQKMMKSQMHPATTVVSAADDKLFEMLKELRQKEARKRGLTSFCFIS